MAGELRVVVEDLVRELAPVERAIRSHPFLAGLEAGAVASERLRSFATPIRLKNVDAIKTPMHPITRKPTSSPSAPKTGWVTEEAIQNTATSMARAVGPASSRT
jgi:hypothetical protein